MIDGQDEDCLHCEIWHAIKKYGDEHAGLCYEEVMESLADVVGDNIWIAKEHAGRMRKVFDERLKRRIALRNTAPGDLTA
jgi:NTP pyrophosphatase (non-canonical NTP hydrolase)